MENKSLLDRIVDILPDNLDEFDDSHAKSFNEIIAMDNHEFPIEKVNFTHLHPNIM
jgi:Fe-S-cluster formation regulator IscX/YfhJ